MARDENVKIFQDTEERVKKDPGLQEAVKYSVAEQVLIPEMMEVTDLMPELIQNRDRYEQDAEIIVSKKRSYEAAAGYRGERVCVHNFADMRRIRSTMMTASIRRKSLYSNPILRHRHHFRKKTGTPLM